MVLGIVLTWLIINVILRRIMSVFGGSRPQQKPPQTGQHQQTPEIFQDIKDAEYTDITEKKA
jgi:hypothetical protein